MNTPTPDRRADPHNYELHLPALVEREMAEMRNKLIREDFKHMQRKFLADAPVSAWGESL